MFCGNCGKQMEDTAGFCPHCGAVVEKETPTVNDSKYARIFVEPDEKYISSLGDGYLNSFLTSQSINRCVALLSDKRVYLRGNMLDVNYGKLGRVNRQQTVDLQDVTGTGFIYVSPKVWQLFLAIIMILIGLVCILTGIVIGMASVVLSILFFMAYFKGRKTYFVIEYAGGCIKFEASIYGLAESQDFEKQIRRAKNKVKENN